ncbi:MAG TPA: serine/threonine-protein kinase [Thermoanaerobaculia bacterium]|nr:serine/threonine-protein kinase [Thermoanaerobaculia bacterium]
MIDPALWKRLDEVFAEALERPPAQRQAFLDEVSRDDPALRDEVERLLAADQAETSFLETPPGELLGLALDELEEGGSLGPYRLLRRIGSGGMGAVYLARREDEHYQRDVAIKVLRSGLASTEAFHRFLAERQILAQLEHPNIARLYDGGSTRDGRPYLVLELIDGVPVDEYCDRHRLSVHQRLALFQKICAAVQYAHQNLLVHRDLKPGNILVTPEGEPKLLDFGIAKRLAPEPGGPGGTPGETQGGVRLLTPSYASPEQVRSAAITTASDVYSLGVILYELLAGRRPYPVAPEQPYEIERIICEREPERPSAALLRPGTDPPPEAIAQARGTHPAELRRCLQGDLDNIVLMALRKDPRSRYSSAAQLSEDLARYLEDLPVAARPETLRYRGRKFLRRNRAAVAITAAVVLLLATFVASLLAQRRQLARERDKARYALSFLVDTFKQADPYQTQGERLTAREILDQGAARVARELAGQPDMQAGLMDAIGEANLGLARHGKAKPLLERALALRRQVFGPGSLEVAESLEHLAACLSEGSRLGEAEVRLREALAIRRRRQGNRDLAVARTLNQLGRLLAQQGAPLGDAPEIEALHQEALAIARRVERPAGATVAESLLDLAELRSLQGQTAAAEQLFREGLEIESRVFERRNPRLYRDQSKYGVLLINAGKLRPAEALLRRCLAIQREMLGREHPDAVETMNDLALAIHLQGRHAESEPLNHEVLSLLLSHYGPLDLRVATAHQNLATDLEPLGRVAEAVDHYHQALAIRRRIIGEGDPVIGQLLLLLAELYRYQEDYPRALDYARQAYEAVVRTRGKDHPHVAYVLRETGRIYSQQHRFREAEPYLRRSLDLRLRILDARHPDLAKSQVSLARCLIGLGRDGEAVPLLREARITFAQVYGPGADISQVPGKLLAEIAARQAQR